MSNSTKILSLSADLITENIQLILRQFILQCLLTAAVIWASSWAIHTFFDENLFLSCVLFLLSLFAYAAIFMDLQQDLMLDGRPLFESDFTNNHDQMLRTFKYAGFLTVIALIVLAWLAILGFVITFVLGYAFSEQLIVSDQIITISARETPLLFLAIMIPSTYCALRISPIFPALASGQRTSLRAAWRLTKYHAGTMLTLAILINLVVTLTGFIFGNSESTLGYSAEFEHLHVAINLAWGTAFAWLFDMIYALGVIALSTAIYQFYRGRMAPAALG